MQVVNAPDCLSGSVSSGIIGRLCCDDGSNMRGDWNMLMLGSFSGYVAPHHFETYAYGDTGQASVGLDFDEYRKGMRAFFLACLTILKVAYNIFNFEGGFCKNRLDALNERCVAKQKNNDAVVRLST